MQQYRGQMYKSIALDMGLYGGSALILQTVKPLIVSTIGAAIYPLHKFGTHGLELWQCADAVAKPICLGIWVAPYLLSGYALYSVTNRVITYLKEHSKEAIELRIKNRLAQLDNLVDCMNKVSILTPLSICQELPTVEELENEKEYDIDLNTE